MITWTSVGSRLIKTSLILNSGINFVGGNVVPSISAYFLKAVPTVIFEATTSRNKSSRLILIISFKALIFFVPTMSTVKISASGSPRTRQLTSKTPDMMQVVRGGWRLISQRCAFKCGTIMTSAVLLTQYGLALRSVVRLL